MNKLLYVAPVVALVLSGACATGSGDDEQDRALPGACSPGKTMCEGDTRRTCLPDGSGWEDELCDPSLGLSCTEDGCSGTCADSVLGESYIGCEYYPTVTGNEVHQDFDFGVVVSNTSTMHANVIIDGGALEEPILFTVAPQSVEVRQLPWVDTLKACNHEYVSPFVYRCPTKSKGAHVEGGSYRLRSNYPVTVYQFSPLDYWTSDPVGMHSYTNDASLLLPANAWRNDYIVASWQAFDSGYAEPGMMAITARTNGTEVTVTTTANTEASDEGVGTPAFAVGVPQTVTMNAGDVLQLFTFEGDLTGTRVSADSPVQVIGGHYCTRVPETFAACDHLEESMFPIETLGNDYVVTKPAVPDTPDGKQQFVRVVAVEDDTQLTFDPPQDGLDYIAKAGEFIELAYVDEDFRITSNRRILVAQYMTGMELGEGRSGDPAMTLAVAAQQYRTEYIFHAPTSYATNYVNLVAPLDAELTLDGDVVSGLTPIGSSGLGVARVELGDAFEGNHTAESDKPFGITVYGYGEWTSYWYPGGLDLAPIEVEPPR